MLKEEVYKSPLLNEPDAANLDNDVDRAAG